MSITSIRMRQIMDWRAAVLAGVVAGLVFLALQLTLRAALLEGGLWLTPRFIAAIVLGQGVLPPPATFHAGIFLVALIVHLALSILFAVILALVIHRWGLLVGIVGGALYGLALYAINFYTFTFFFPWFFPIRSWIDVLGHLVFGAVAGGVYEALEREIYVPAEPPPVE